MYVEITYAETKTLTLQTPIVDSGGTVTFNQAASPTNTTITNPATVSYLNGSATITVIIKDYANNAMVGITPILTTSNNNVTIACNNATTSTGSTTCTLTDGYQTGNFTITMTSPISGAGAPTSTIKGQ